MWHHIPEDHNKIPLQKSLPQPISRNVYTAANDKEDCYFNKRWHKLCKTMTPL
jgi:hypothetical protein